ncbi:HD domain-containing phosphohydrolase [Alcaligenes sp. RM2]|uniref:response regulator n=1 Tax=Alcaligenes TaxID=507 RepID=UPI0002AA9355|nr:MULTISPECIES: two-component system response regulator [Alcaligenes]EKU29738.1 response regulator [Alcaligenes sp. HPC1271]ERI34923.1 chemotaxis protein CheY [Alcaligenes sp. EGD-AK7]URW84181.1 two-component system response regulator [Alcaligenes sp. DN25]UTM01900.1 two-component system response regulator [Alcaligenes sp. NLF5-7]WEA69021.1 two-component system response regulator [Alcaligenes faecalis]
MNEFTSPRPTLLLIDDEPANLQILRHTLQQDFRLLFAKDGIKALELAQRDLPDLILLDIMMPQMSGYEVCRALKADLKTRHIPVVFVTALSQPQDEQMGLDMGAVDYISKPFNPAILKARIRNHLSLVQMQELRDSRLQIIRCLGTAAEYKDNEVGRHVIRMSHYTRILAHWLGYSSEAADELLHAAPMHDIGKIGIPDSILQKPGKLTPEEWEIMRTHTLIGARIIGQHSHGLLKLARTIALYHHEKWDGSGYPYGLTGENIPLPARIVAVADVFDALASERPYKKAWSVESCISYLREQSGQHFDPQLIALLDKCLPEMLHIKEKWADDPQPMAKT